LTAASVAVAREAAAEVAKGFVDRARRAAVVDAREKKLVLGKRGAVAQRASEGLGRHVVLVERRLLRGAVVGDGCEDVRELAVLVVERRIEPRASVGQAPLGDEGEVAAFGLVARQRRAVAALVLEGRAGKPRRPIGAVPAEA